MSIPMRPDQIPAEMKAELLRVRGLAQKCNEMVFDGDTASALCIVRTTKQNIHLVTPVVVSVPIGDLVMFVANALLAMPHLFAPQNIARPQQ